MTISWELLRRIEVSIASIVMHTGMNSNSTKVKVCCVLCAQGQPQIRGMTCSTNAYGITADFRLHNKAVKGWEFSKVRVVCAWELVPGQMCLVKALRPDVLRAV